MLTRKQKDANEALEYCQLTSMPKKWHQETSKRIWVDAIIEVRKIDGSESYAYAHNKYGCTPSYKKVFGKSATIIEILSIHPIHYLEKDFIQKFDDVNALRVRMAQAYGLTDEQIMKIADEDIVNMAYNNAIQSQLVFVEQAGKDKYKQEQNDKNEQIFKEITEGAVKRD